MLLALYIYYMVGALDIFRHAESKPEVSFLPKNPNQEISNWLTLFVRKQEINFVHIILHLLKGLSYLVLRVRLSAIR